MPGPMVRDSKYAEIEILKRERERERERELDWQGISIL